MRDDPDAELDRGIQIRTAFQTVVPRETLDSKMQHSGQDGGCGRDFACISATMRNIRTRLDITRRSALLDDERRRARGQIDAKLGERGVVGGPGCPPLVHGRAFATGQTRGAVTKGGRRTEESDGSREDDEARGDDLMKAKSAPAVLSVERPVRPVGRCVERATTDLSRRFSAAPPATASGDLRLRAQEPGVDIALLLPCRR